MVLCLKQFVIWGWYYVVFIFGIVVRCLIACVVVLFWFALFMLFMQRRSSYFAVHWCVAVCIRGRAVWFVHVASQLCV